MYADAVLQWHGIRSTYRDYIFFRMLNNDFYRKEVKKMEDYQIKKHELVFEIGNQLWDLRNHIRGDQESIAETYEWLSKWLAVFEDDLYPDDEEN